MDEPVTVTVAYQVTPGGEDTFSDWAMAMLQEAAQYVEYLGGGILAPGETEDDWHVVSRWSSPEAAKLWEASPARARLVRSASGFAQPARTKRTTGVRAWFDLSSRMATPPPKWKTALVTLAAVFPPVLAFNLTVIPYLGGVPAVLRTLTLCVAVTAVVTWVMMPRLLKLLRNWLNPPPLEAEGVDVGAPEPAGAGRIGIGRRQRGWSGGETATADFGYGGGGAGPAWLAEVAPRQQQARQQQARQQQEVDDGWREAPAGSAPWYSSRRQEPAPEPSYDPAPGYRDEEDRGGWYREPQESGSWYREPQESGSWYREADEPEPRRYRDEPYRDEPHRDEPHPDERYWAEQEPGRWYRERDATEILPAIDDDYDEPAWRPIREPGTRPYRR